jgi:hypothetical protein
MCATSEQVRQWGEANAQTVTITPAGGEPEEFRIGVE